MFDRLYSVSLPETRSYYQKLAHYTLFLMKVALKKQPKNYIYPNQLLASKSKI